MKLQEMLQLKGDGFDISDDDWDWGTYIEAYSPEDVYDSYDRFMVYLAENIEIVKFNENWYSPCKVAQFIVEHQAAFRQFFNEENREGYRPKDYKEADDPTVDEGFYEVYLCGLESLMVGNYTEEDYSKLLKLLTKKE